MEDVVDGIRKLLRLAKESPNKAEATLARERAEALMRKHRVEVTVDDGSHRVAVPGVVGSYWKSQLLAGLTRVRRCKLLQRDDGSEDSVVIGPKEDVDAVVADYRRYYVEILLRCHVMWLAAEKYEASRESVSSVEDAVNMMFEAGFGVDAPDSESIFKTIAERATKAEALRLERIKKSRERVAKTAELWHSAFLDTVADYVSERLQPRVKPKPEVSYERARLPFGLPPTMSDTERERKRLDETIRDMDADLAQKLLRTAYSRALQVVDKLPLCWSTSRQLAAASAAFEPPPPPIPPPPPPAPTRFNQIDID